MKLALLFVALTLVVVVMCSEKHPQKFLVPPVGFSGYRYYTCTPTTFGSITTSWTIRNQRWDGWYYTNGQDRFSNLTCGGEEYGVYRTVEFTMRIRFLAPGSVAYSAIVEEDFEGGFFAAFTEQEAHVQKTYCDTFGCCEAAPLYNKTDIKKCITSRCLGSQRFYNQYVWITQSQFVRVPIDSAHCDLERLEDLNDVVDYNTIYEKTNRVRNGTYGGEHNDHKYMVHTSSPASVILPSISVLLCALLVLLL